MSRTTYYSHSNPRYEEKRKRFNEIFEWISAFDAYDLDDPQPLSDLVSGDEPIPLEARKPLSEIILGLRRPNKRAASKLKIPTTKRLEIAAEISVVMGLFQVLTLGGNATDRNPDGTTTEYKVSPSIDEMADARMIEPQQEIEKRLKERREFILDAANDLGVSTETIENLLRIISKKIENFPEI